MTGEEIIARLPYSEPFLFVDTIDEISENHVVGTYTYPASSDFYRGHFKGNPVTPGVILTETTAQIGLVCLGIYLNRHLSEEEMGKIQVALTHSDMRFFKPVYPDDKIIVSSDKELFRFGKLKCNVKMENTDGELICRGSVSGMITQKL